MKKYYLLSTEHLEDGLWFRDDKDFLVAMNHVAIEASRFSGKVTVLAFVLMSNHVHFVLFGKREDAIDLIISFKRRFSHYLSNRYGKGKYLKNNDLDVKEVTRDDDGLERVISYVQMNPVAARICSHPTQYPWGSSSVFFNSKKISGKRLGDISARTKSKILHSFCPVLPEEWKIGDEGYILPENYVDVKWVERLFRTPTRMNFFYSGSSKARKRMESGFEDLPAFRDQTILQALPDMCRSLFQKVNFESLSGQERKELFLQIRYRFSADITQIARVCGVTYAEAAKIWEDF